MEVTFYTTGCPNCIMLKKLLDMKGIEYTKVEDIDTMQKMGLSSVPCLKVNNILMSYQEAKVWVTNYNG